MRWSVNDVMPGSDGLRIWGFCKRRQLGVDFGPCKTDDFVSAFGHRELSSLPWSRELES